MTNTASSATHRTETQLIKARHWINYPTIAERRDILPEFVDKEKFQTQTANCNRRRNNGNWRPIRRIRIEYLQK